MINVDESLLGQSDFRRRKWMVPGTSNSVAKKALQPRVSMIAALDNLGGVFISLVQGNSNSKIMEVYFQTLCRKLEKEDKAYKDNVVVLLDNAAYHTCPATLSVLRRLQLQVLFTGPNSYLAAPVELLFGAFKQADINPRKVMTAKR